MSNVATPEVVYEWRAPVGPALVKKERLTIAGLLGTGAAMVGWGLVSSLVGVGADVRFLIVAGAFMLCLGALSVLDSRRLRSTVIRVDRTGTLSFSDTKRQSALDLRTVPVLSIRRRSGQPQWRWSIEAANEGGAWHAELAGIATYWNLGEADVANLEQELGRWHAWATTNTPHARSAVGAAPPPASANQPIAVRGAVTSTPHDFEWQPPEHPNKARNRRRLRIGVGAVALFIAIVAAISEAENGVTAVLFSMFVPVLILVLGFGIDRAYDLGRRFRIGVDRNGLSIRRSSKPPVVVPASAIASLQITLSQAATHDAGVESSNWVLAVVKTDGETVRSALPLWLGSSFVRNDAIALEAELRRRLEVAP